MAIDFGAPPLVLLADHRPAGSILPIYVVDDPDATGQELAAAGWEHEMGPVEVPEGPVTLWRDGSGTSIALLRLDRPGALEGHAPSPPTT